MPRSVREGRAGLIAARGLGPDEHVRWRQFRANEYLELRYGKALVASSRRDGEVPVFGSNGQCGLHDTPLFKGPGVVLGRKGQGPLGVEWVDQDHWVIDTAYSLRITRPDQIDLKFAYYLIKFVGLNHLKDGTSNPSLSRDTFGLQRLPVPPIEAQRGIAATLGALDDKIDSNRRIVALCEHLGDAVLRASSSSPQPLGEVATITMGSSPPGDSYNETREGMPFFQGVRDFGSRSPSQRVWTTAPIRTATPNDTLLSVRAPVGRLNRATTTCCVGRGVAAISSASPSTVYYALRAADAVWDPFRSEGTVFGAVSKGDVLGARVPWPTNSAREIEAKLDALDQKINSALRESNRLAALRDALLPELLSGRIRVPEALEAVRAV